MEWTGLDRTKAKDSIYAFLNSCSKAVNQLRHANFSMFENLMEIWASPNAVNFSMTYDRKFDDAVREINRMAIDIIKNAERAYTIAANAQGLDGIEGLEQHYIPQVMEGLDDVAYILRASKDNLVGMNINMVLNELLPNYRKTFNNVMSLFDEIPDSIELYDDEDGQKHAFSTEVSSLKEKALYMVEYLFSEIEKAAKTESDNIKLAKQQAIDVMNG